MRSLKKKRRVASHISTEPWLSSSGMAVYFVPCKMSVNILASSFLIPKMPIKNNYFEKNYSDYKLYGHNRLGMN